MRRADITAFRVEKVNRTRIFDEHGSYQGWWLSESLIREAAALGVNQIFLRQLSDLIWGRYLYSVSAAYVVEVLRGWEAWRDDPSGMPAHVRKVENGIQDQKPAVLDLDRWVRSGWAGKPMTLVAKTIHSIASQHLSVRGEKAIHGLQFGCYLLDVASQLGNIDAAALLLKLSVSTRVSDLVKTGQLVLNEAGAKSLIYPMVENEPENCPWNVLEAYMCTEYGDRLLKLRKHSDRQLGWALDVLFHAADSMQPPNGNTNYDWEDLGLTEIPWKYLHRISGYCCRNAIRAEGYPPQKMRQLYAQSLRRLADYHDPGADFASAIVNGPFPYHTRPDWEQPLMSAATTGNAEACWLLAIHYWYKDGILPIKSDLPGDSLIKSVAFDWARAAIFASSVETAFGGGPGSLVNRGLALAAFYKALDQQHEGEILFADLITWTRNDPRFPRSVSNQLSQFLVQYTARSADAKQEDDLVKGKLTLRSKDACRGIVERATNFDEILRGLRQRLIGSPSTGD